MHSFYNVGCFNNVILYEDSFSFLIVSGAFYSFASHTLGITIVPAYNLYGNYTGRIA